MKEKIKVDFNNTCFNWSIIDLLFSGLQESDLIFLYIMELLPYED